MSLSAAALFQPELLVLELSATDAPGAIAELSSRFQERGLLTDAAHFTELVLAREQICSTALGSGVAFPHARTNLVSEISVAIGRHTPGVRFAPEQPLTQLIFLIGTPTSMVREYLDLVGQLARRLRAEELRQQLLRAATPQEFIAALTSQAGAK
jgi:PTS system fructose-specific IIA component